MITYEASCIHFSSLHFYLLYLLLNSCDRNDGKPATWKQRIKPVYRRRYEGRRSSKPKLQWKQKIIIKYSEKRIKYRGKEFLHPSMWHVALESWQWNHHVAAPCNVIRGSAMTCHWIRPSSALLEFYTWFRFRPRHRSRHVILHQFPTFYPNRTTLGRNKMTSCRFSRWRISAILDFRDPIIGSLKSPCATSSMDTVALNCLVFEKIAFLHLGARQTNRWTATTPMH